MLTRIGLFVLLMFLFSCIVTLCGSEAQAAGLRRRRMVSPAYYNTKAPVAQPTIETKQENSSKSEGNKEIPYQTSKPVIPSITAAAALPQHRGFSNYEPLGLDFSELIAALPEQEKQILQSVCADLQPDYQKEIEKKYPDIRPEVAESLAKIAEAIHQKKNRNEIGAMVKALPFSTRQLTSKEVLAINEELGPVIDPEEFRAVHELNQFRMRSGLRPCLIDLLLCLVSRGHSSDMRNYGFFSHNSPVAGKGSFTMRAGQFGASASAENIYMGSSNGRAANNAWANSSGHRANMLGGFSRVGVGRAGGFFTQMFGF